MKKTLLAILIPVIVALISSAATVFGVIWQANFASGHDMETVVEHINDRIIPELEEENNLLRDTIGTLKERIAILEYKLGEGSTSREIPTKRPVLHRKIPKIHIEQMSR